MDLAVDQHLTGKARFVWPWAVVREEQDGSWWLTRTPGGLPVLLSPYIGTPDKPRLSFHAARLELYRLRDEALASR